MKIFNSWPKSKQKKFKAEYPVTPNADIMKKYGLTVGQIRYIAEAHNLKKDADYLLKHKANVLSQNRKSEKKPYNMKYNLQYGLPVINKMNLNYYFKSLEGYNLFLERYPKTSNKELIQEFNLTKHQVEHISRILKLSKDKSHLKAMFSEIQKKRRESMPKPEKINIKTIKVDKAFPKSHTRKSELEKAKIAADFEKRNKGQIKSIAEAIQEEISAGKVAVRIDSKTIVFKKVA